MRHIDRDLEQLRRLVLQMGGLVEQSLEFACAALMRRDETSAIRAQSAERDIDRMEIRIDDECLKLLALHQPVAGDLRFITAAMKITTDLERIGDLAENMGQRVLLIVARPPLIEPLGFHEMVERTCAMLHDALNAFVSRNSALARDVCKRDDAVDAINRAHFDTLQARMKRDSSSIETAVALLSVSRNIERIADLATNIAEDVVFEVEAVDIRHPNLAAG